MNWKASRPAFEIAVEWIAAACLGGAVAFAVARLVPHGAGIAVAAGAIVAAVALLILARVDRQRGSIDAAFAEIDFQGDEAADVPAVDDGDVLLLDDPLPAIDPDSRVVRLFAAAPVSANSTSTSAGPGEMMSRIENYLEVARASAAAAEAVPAANHAASIDANAALHAALADIRRSLRQG